MKKMLNVSSLVLGLTFLFVSVGCLGGTRSEDPTGGDNNVKMRNFTNDNKKTFSCL